ncbi:MAG: T9SS type A sorting domain-containing protein [Chitinophagales bacterium]|nr:T9SS type A sorting domain-containing protein [Chitinophagales bacterium]
MNLKLHQIVVHILSQSILMICTCISSHGQIKIPNPSFEFQDTFINYFAPPPWVICKFSPDLINYPTGNNYPKPSDGINYIAIFADNYGFSGCEYEKSQVKLFCKLIPNIKYRLSVDICTDRGRYFDLAQLIVYGGSSNCSETDTLWESPYVDTVKWQHYNFTFIPSHQIEYLSLTAAPQFNFSYLFIDNLSSIFIDSGYTAIKTQSSANTIVNGEFATLSNDYLIGTQTEYKIQWRQNGDLIGNAYSINVYPSTTTTYFVKATDSCGYYSTDSITISVTPNNKAYYNSTEGKLQLQYSLRENATFKIYNMLGQLEKESTLSISKHESEIDVHALIQGVYIICIQNDFGKTIWRQKILIYNL